MKGAKPFDNLRRQIEADPVARAEVEEMKRAMRDVSALARLREAREKTQVALASALGVSQSNVSRIERQDDLYLSTLREYVEALGGRLQLAAVFPDQTILLTGVGEEAGTEEQQSAVYAGHSVTAPGEDIGATDGMIDSEVGKDERRGQ